MIRRRHLLSVLLVVFLGSTAAHAAKKKAPVAGTTFFPVGAQRGMTSIITLSTKLDPVGRDLSIDCPGVQLIPGEKNLVQVSIAPTAPLGLHLIHVFNSDGASEPRWFSIGTLPEILEKEPNDTLGAEQAIDSLPVCVNGQFNKRGDTDLYAFDLKEGQTLVAAVEAYAIGSAVDAFLQLRDEGRTVLATAHDGRNLDPLLTFKAAKTGRYSLELAGFAHPPTADINFTGGTAMSYRLHLTTEPATLRVFPAAVSRTSKNTLDLLGSISAPAAIFDGSRLPAGPLIQTITPPAALFPIQVAVTDTAVQREAEPNNELAQAMPLAVPACVAGRIDKAGDVDRFSFQAKKGGHFTFRLLAKSLGLPLDALLVVCDSTDTELARNDDASEGDDPLLSWKAPADGLYQVKVTDLFNRGGEAAEYVLMLGTEEPDFSATVTSKPPLILEAGKTLEFKGSVKRSKGFTGELFASVHGLPPGVEADAVPLPAKDGEFTVVLKAAGNAALSNGPIQLVVATKGDKVPSISHTAVFDLRGDIRRGTSLLDQTDFIWMTVLPATPALPAVISPAPAPH
ncbi:MAG: hypothetical protein JWO94_3486 [Verrucomicrobiaceae bacterium]|nr:hypothetical protein [Verrucomicrobiaceae bacterium]